MSKHSLSKFFNKYNDLNTDTIALFASYFNIPIYERIIWDIVQAGDLEQFKLIIARMDLDHIVYTQYNIEKLLKIAVFNDHLEILKYMMNLWDIDPDKFYKQIFKR